MDSVGFRRLTLQLQTDIMSVSVGKTKQEKGSVIIVNLKQKIDTINFQPVGDEDVSHIGQSNWWLLRTKNPHLFSIFRNNRPSKLGDYQFLTDINGYLQPAIMSSDVYEAVKLNA